MSSLILMVGGSSLLGQDFGPVTEEPRGAQIEQGEREIAYAWSMDGERYGLTLRLGLPVDEVRKHYREAPHELYMGKSLDTTLEFIDRDPFPALTECLASGLKALAEERRVDRIRLAIAFVQSLPYQAMGFHQRYAGETLIDAQGDCSDTSMLLAAILKSWDVRVALVVFPGHMGVGIHRGELRGWKEPALGNFVYCETTGFGYPLGDIPEDCRGQESRLYWVTKSRPLVL